ncbi:MAG: hypothetical protein ACK56I_03110 [bacterium]
MGLTGLPNRMAAKPSAYTRWPTVVHSDPRRATVYNPTDGMMARPALMSARSHALCTIWPLPPPSF